jgi:hypothetical protein
VILAGFDCYGGTPRATNQHGDYVPHLKQFEVRVASGPLLQYWKQYSREEEMPHYAPPDVFVETEHGVRVKVIKPVEIRGHVWPAGSVLHVPKAEVWRQIKHRSLEELPAEVVTLSTAEPEEAPNSEPEAPLIVTQDVRPADAPKRRGRPPKKAQE